MIHATGQYGAEVNTNAPFKGSVEYKFSSKPVFDVAVVENERKCDRYPLSGTRTAQTRAGPSIYPIATQLYPGNDGRFHHVLLTIFAATQRNVGAHRISYNDLFRMTDALVDQSWTDGVREVAANITQELVTRYANPSSLLTDKGAQFVADTAVKLMIDHYLRGQDPGTTIEGLKTQLVDHLQSQASELVKGIGGDNLGDALAATLDPYLKDLANDVKSLLSDVKPDAQSGQSSASSDECTWLFSVNWSPTSSNFSAIFDKRCGELDEVPTLTPVIPTVKPDDKGAAITIQMFDHSGVAYPLASAAISGLSAITGAADPVPARKNASTFEVVFDVKKPLADRDGGYPLVITATTPPSLGNKSGRWNGPITVLNVAPKITNVQVTKLEGDPGDPLRFTRTAVTVVDDNADSTNSGEVTEASMSLGPHPADLKMTTRNAFGAIDRKDRNSFDGTKGEYVFDFSRNGGRIEEPHMHGDWTTTLTIQDDDGESADETLELVVRDVDPEIEQPRVSPRFVHHVEGHVTVTGRFRDANGVDDIDREASYVDPKDADAAEAPKKLVLGDGLDETGAGDDFIAFSGTFEHTKDPGVYDIDFHTQDLDGADHPDGPNLTDEVKQLGVGNQKPIIEPWGYIYSSELQEPEPEQREGLCPGQPFLAGAIVKDFENDPLTAKATIVETGATVALLLAPMDKTHKGILRAPMEPKEYTLRFEAKEDPPFNEIATPKSSPLRVIACADEIITDFSVDTRVTRSKVCPGESFTVEAWEIRFEDGKPPENIYRDGTVTFQGDTRTISPTILAANFNAPSKPGTYPIGIELRVGDPPGTPTSLGEVVEVVRCDLGEEKDDELISTGTAIDLIERPDLTDPFSGDQDPTVQLMIVDWAVVSPLVVQQQEAAIHREIREALLAAAELGGRPTTRLTRTPFPRLVSTVASSTVTQPQLPHVQTFISSLGNSTGEAFELRVLNRGNAPIQLVGNGVVVEALKEKASELARRELEKLADKLPIQLELDAYCLEFLKRPPDLNRMFRFAPAEIQQQFEPMRKILGASRELFDAGVLTPDVDPASYFHSIRQWSIWTEERGFDLEGFEKAFLERTKKNFEAAKQPWNDQIETTVRGLVPNRYKDVVQILEHARRRGQ